MSQKTGSYNRRIEFVTSAPLGIKCRCTKCWTGPKLRTYTTGSSATHTHTGESRFRRFIGIHDAEFLWMGVYEPTMSMAPRLASSSSIL